jgi:hypothetical protein
VAGRDWFYYVAIAGILLVLIFSANTAFADFPRVCRFVAEDGYLPTSFSNRGRRLVYTEGIVVLAVVTGLLLLVFRGVTDRLIPLFAVGAFLAFTMSQAGMVAHWRRTGGDHARHYMVINGIGAVATGATVLIVIAAKFREGAWITLIAIPSLLALMYGIHRHYERVQSKIATRKPLVIAPGTEPLVVVTVTGWDRVSRQALHFAMTLSDEVKVVHVREEEEDNAEFTKQWQEYVAGPAGGAHVSAPELVELRSPYRFVLEPIVQYVRGLAKDNPERLVIAIVPELMETRWYYYFLHAQRATLLTRQLLADGTDRVAVLNVPWYLKET